MSETPAELLRRDEDQALMLLNSSPISVVIVNKLGEFLFANKRAYELARLPYGAPLPNTKEIYVEPNRRGELFTKFTAEGKLRDEEAEFRRPDGTTFWGLISWEMMVYNSPSRITGSKLASSPFSSAGFQSGNAARQPRSIG